MLLPPPNVTGRLHMGHMLNQTEMDILTRWHRMRGETSLWVPGTDHAGIATQMMVERQLAAEGTNRKALGREAFTERVWEWKRQYGSAITDQMRRLGASVDWSREYFTMDDRLSVAVKEAFVRLYEQGLIYRGAYIVNWDPIQQTAVSDLEVTHEERVGKLYHIRYPFADGTRLHRHRHHPPRDAARRRRRRRQPQRRALQGIRRQTGHASAQRRRWQARARDPHPRRRLGPARVRHRRGQGHARARPQRLRHRPAPLAAVAHHPRRDRAHRAARLAVPRPRPLRRTRKASSPTSKPPACWSPSRTTNLAIALSQRTGAVIEPRLSMQWFLAVNKPVSDSRPSIAQTAIDAVREGHIKFTPDMYAKTYMEWMTNIHDWCISRQLWWGHRIPAWHCAACGKITVARDTHRLLRLRHHRHPPGHRRPRHLVLLRPAALHRLRLGCQGQGYGRPRRLLSHLPPRHRLRHPLLLGRPHDHARHPLHARRPHARRQHRARSPKPSHSSDVYIHALVRDANREKMSKTKGNVIDPIEIITKYGTDAVRFTLASQASPGTDIAFNEARTEGYRAFANKIWNAARFLFMNLDRAREAGYKARDHAVPHISLLSSWAGVHRTPRPHPARNPLDLRPPLRRLRRSRIAPSPTTASTKPPTPSISSSGASSATGTSNSSSSASSSTFPSTTTPPSLSPRSPASSRPRCACSRPSCPSSPKRSGTRSTTAHRPPNPSH